MASFVPKRSSAVPFPQAYVINLYSGGEVVGRWRSETLDVSEVSQLPSGGAAIPLGGGPGGELLYVSGTFSVEPERLDE